MNIDRKEFLGGVAEVMGEQLAARDQRLESLDKSLQVLEDARRELFGTNAGLAGRVHVFGTTLDDLRDKVAALPGDIAPAAEVKALYDRIAEVGEDVQKTITRLSAELRESLEAKLLEQVGELTAHAITAQQGEAEGIVKDLQTRLIDALTRVANVRDGDKGDKGDPGERGEPGGFAVVKHYEPGEIYKAGTLVYCAYPHPRNWALAEAKRDTYDIPGDPDSEDWEPRLFNGERGPGFIHRGHHVDGEFYKAGDNVVSDLGSSWVRTFDGVSTGIPDDGWALMVKQGRKGDKGDRGERGSQGKPGASVTEVVYEKGHLVFMFDDGRILPCEIPANFPGPPV